MATLPLRGQPTRGSSATAIVVARPIFFAPSRAGLGAGAGDGGVVPVQALAEGLPSLDPPLQSSCIIRSPGTKGLQGLKCARLVYTYVCTLGAGFSKRRRAVRWERENNANCPSPRCAAACRPPIAPARRSGGGGNAKRQSASLGCGDADRRTRIRRTRASSAIRGVTRPACGIPLRMRGGFPALYRLRGLREATLSASPLVPAGMP